MKKIASMTLIGLLIPFLTFSLLFGSLFDNDDPYRESYLIAQKLIDPPYQNKVFWIKAEGPISLVNKWSYYFYDTNTPKNARMVKIVDGKVDQVKPSDFSSKAQESLVFDPILNKVTAQMALQKVADYAQVKAITYDSVKMELRRSSLSNVYPTWQIRLYQNDHYSGIVYLNDVDGSVVSYKPAITASEKANAFFNDVEKTFKGIGGDMEEFFTGERSVDQ